MKTSEKILVGLGYLVLAAGLVFGIMRAHPIQQVAAEPAQKVGAISSPNLPFTYLQWGSGYGMAFVPTVQPLTLASTTPSFIISPNATSTLERAAIRFDTSSTTSMTIAIGKGSSTGVISNQIGTNYVIAAGAAAFIEASSTQGTALGVFPPNTPLVVTATGGTGTYSPTGTFSALWDVMPQ